MILVAIDIDQAVDNLSSTFLTHIRESIPEKSFTIQVRPKDKPWFDSALRKEIRLRNRLSKIAMKSNNPVDMTKIKKSRNKVYKSEKNPYHFQLLCKFRIKSFGSKYE